MGPAPRPPPGSLSAQSHRAPSAAPPLLIRWKAGLLPQRRGTSAASGLWLVRGSLALSAFGAPVAAPRLLVRTTLRVSGRQLRLRCAALRELAGSRADAFGGVRGAGTAARLAMISAPQWNGWTGGDLAPGQASCTSGMFATNRQNVLAVSLRATSQLERLDLPPC